MTTKTFLILGGGIGGITVANELQKHLGSRHKIVLVDKSGEYLLASSLLWMMVGNRRRDQITRDLHTMVNPGVEFVKAEVQKIDPEHNCVIAGGRELGYDTLIVALGADLAPDLLPGFAAAAHNFYDLNGASDFWNALKEFEGGRVAVLISSVPFKCPAAPYEAAFLVEAELHRRNVKAEIAVYTPEPQPMPVAGPKLGTAITHFLHEHDVKYYPNRPVASIDAEHHELVFKDGTHEQFDLLAGVPPHRAPRVVKESSLSNEAGWASVDKHTLRTRFENVYVVGDSVSISLTNGKPLPKAAVLARSQGLAVANTLAAEVGIGQEQKFDGAGYCFLELGNGLGAFAAGNFYAEPDPVLQLLQPERLWHLEKEAFEQHWLSDGLK